MSCYSTGISPLRFSTRVRKAVVRRRFTRCNVHITTVSWFLQANMILTRRKRSCEKGMFSRKCACLSAILSTWIRGKVTWDASWDRSYGKNNPRCNWTSDLGTCSDSRSDIWWWSLETCYKHCSFRDLHLLSTPKWHLVVAPETEACTISKQAVCILLECCLLQYHVELNHWNDLGKEGISMNLISFTLIFDLFIKTAWFLWQWI